MFEKSYKKIAESGHSCVCGACVALDQSGKTTMIDTPYGPIPNFEKNTKVLNKKLVCSCVSVNYPDLYEYHFGKHPDNWLIGKIKSTRIGFSNEPNIRINSASGGVITQTLIFLLENNLVDAVIVAKQGFPSPERASPIITNNRNEIIRCAQSIYTPVPMLQILKKINLKKKYAITCVPEQSASLRALQRENFSPALQIKYVLGPYTGTALYPEAIRCYLRSKNITETDGVERLKWREGDWPGYLEIKTKSGKTVRTPKVYYNYLIPFFITQTSLQSMDFTNEFADLAVGDAWSPEFESKKEGYSVVVTRTSKMETIIKDMISKDILNLQTIEPMKALDMHGHMLDFKKRGGYIRNKWRKLIGIYSPDFGYKPAKITVSRVIIEIFISSIFFVGRTKSARCLISKLPESYIGPTFNYLRLFWKMLSRPTKRKGLREYEVIFKK